MCAAEMEGNANVQVGCDIEQIRKSRSANGKPVFFALLSINGS